MTRTIDFGRTAADYARHRQGYAPEFFERLAALGVCAPGARALDLGTGTGQMARGLAGLGMKVTALDRSSELLVAGRALDGGASIERLRARAEALPFASASLELVTAAQCWRWFDEPRAAAEVTRVLAPGGALVVAQLDWIPLPGSVVEATERLILAHNPAWELAGFDGIPTYYLPPLEAAGFGGLELFAYDLDLTYTHADWRGRIRASAGIAASLEPEAVARFDAELGALLARDFPADPLAVPHRAFALVMRPGRSRA